MSKGRKKGFKHSEETKIKMSNSRIGKSNISGIKHYLWKGEKASYEAKHIWIRTHYGNATKCEKCDGKNAKRFEWANISGKYLRNIKDYMQLCPSCHRLMDRGNKCRNGHKFTKENMWIRIIKKDGIKRTMRVCRECQKGYSRIYQAKQKIKLCRV